ncbi:MAG TPA: response regulator [Tepidisphaeraceae bacterium]|nr:response regulator [Tepidisphaeraceae bacterium]
MADVLIIDDDPDNCEVITRFLTRAGHSARSAPNGRRALSALVARVPDFIVLDVLMPGLDGIDLLDVIRSYLRWTLVPVAILTAFPEDPRLSRAAELGVTRVFTKSAFELNDLLACVNEHAGRSSEPPGRPEARG